MDSILLEGVALDIVLCQMSATSAGRWREAALSTKGCECGEFRLKDPEQPGRWPVTVEKDRSRGENDKQ